MNLCFPKSWLHAMVALQRIQTFDKITGLNSVRIINPAAMDIAKQRDIQVRHKLPLDLLSDVPFVFPSALINYNQHAESLRAMIPM